MGRKWWTLVSVCLGIFMLLLDITIVNVALPAIQHSLKSSFSDLQWVVDAYALTLASLLLTTGSLADLYGRRVLFTIGLVVFSAGSLMCGVAQSSEWLILARAGQGVGGAVMFSTSLALLAQAFQGRERGIAFGIWGSITGIAVAVGPVLGGVLTTDLSWRWIFLVNVPVGAFAVGVTLLRVDESRQPGASTPDWAGFATFTAALVSLVYALIRTGEKGWSNTVVIACFVAAGVLLLAFTAIELRTSRAMFDLSLFRKPTFAGGSIAAFGISASAFSVLLYIVLYLQDARGYSALATGLRLVIYSAAILVAATISGRLTSLVPIRLLIGPGLMLVGLGLLLMTGLTARSSWTVLVPGFIVAGIGTGMLNPPLASTAVGVVEPYRAGMASGINSTFRQVGIATGIAVLGSVYASRVRGHIHTALAGLHLPNTSQFATGVVQGNTGSIASAPPALRPRLASAALDGVVRGLDAILLIAAFVAFFAGVFSLGLIRARDFAAGSQMMTPEPRSPGGLPQPAADVHGPGAGVRHSS